MGAFCEIPLIERTFATLDLIERRGFSVRLECLAEWMLGGSVDPGLLGHLVAKTEGLFLSDGLVHTQSFDLASLGRTLERQRLHPAHCLKYWPEVEEFVQRLKKRCPQIRCIALAGSMAAGGFVESDDVDFNLFVEDGTRYTTYLQAALLALEFSIRHRRRPTDAHSRRWLFPKLMSINVIWTDSDIRPFVRRDGAMALELFLSRPLMGESYFNTMLGCNPWLDDYFPQVGSGQWACNRLQQQPKPFQLLQERLSYQAAYLGWRWVMWCRRHNPEALARVAQVRRYQSPYALFEMLPK
ncbi:MAG: hypothetical protein H7Y37_03985 [Anaerolineae bacterium]|nr:hypothetical protein [Gloeobacterales cyanobacterium ES-bin-313]